MQIEKQKNRLTQIAIPKELAPQQQQAARRAVDVSFVGAFRRVMLISATLAALSALVGWRLLEQEVGSANDARV
jgi:hypothetical protein